MRPVPRRLLRALMSLAGAIALVIATPGLVGATGDSTTDAETEADVSVDAEVEADAELDADAEADVDADADAETDADVDSDADVDADLGVNGDAETEGDDVSTLTMETVWATAIDQHPCDDSELHFVINQLRGGVSAPASITVELEGGAQIDVARDGGPSSTTVAHYTVTDIESHANPVVVRAWAEMSTDWSGRFNLSHGPCESDVTGAGDVDADTETESETDVDTETEVNTDTEVDSDTRVDTDTEVDTDAGIDTDTDTDVEGETETDTGAEVDTGMDTETGADTDVEVEGDVEVRNQETVSPTSGELGGQQPTAVLSAGTRAGVSGSSLPVTGADSTAVLAAGGAGLLLGGIGLELLSRRRSAAAAQSG